MGNAHSEGSRSTVKHSLRSFLPIAAGVLYIVVALTNFKLE